jgi:succinyl-CoA synthetase alpha subunit
MSILINKNTRVITQGITGKTGRFHTYHGRRYANGEACYVAGCYLTQFHLLPAVGKEKEKQ